MKTITIILGLSILMIGISAIWEEPTRVTPYSFEQVPYFPKMPVSPENPVTEQGQQLGRLLFYDPILSRDSSISCANCHKQEFAFSGGNNPFDKGIDGQEMTRNTPGLFNLAWYERMFWDGRATSIESQVFHPVSAHDEMDLDWPTATERIQSHRTYPLFFQEAFGTRNIDSVLIAYAIAQFERTLVSHNSKFDQVLRGERYFTKAEYNGFQLVSNQVKGNCFHCHTSDGDGLGTTGKFANNGLDTAYVLTDYRDHGKATHTSKKEDGGVFKIPSFRNLAFTAPYMHDGRFQTLEEVIDFYSEGVQTPYNIDSKMAFAHEGGAQLTKIEKEHVLAFLLTLSDSSFIMNPEFSNPYVDTKGRP